MAVVTSFSEGENFWELNPQLLLHSVFKEYYKADKSRGKKDSSVVMWWVALCYDMDRDNKWRGQLLSEKQPMIAEELGLGDKFLAKRGEEVAALIAAYVKFADTAAKRQLRSLERKLDEKTETLDGMHYKDDPEGIDKMLASNEKHYKMLASIQKQLSEEDGEGVGMGGSQASLSDDGSI